MSVVADHRRPEPLPEQVPDPLVAAVEALGECAVDQTHRRGEILEPGLDDEMEMVAHHAVRVQLQAVAPSGTEDQPDERAAILVVEDDRPARHAAHRDVEEPERGKHRSRETRHTCDRSGVDLRRPRIASS